jgi:diguanylate cyclase (GGDEF)-like protein
MKNLVKHLDLLDFIEAEIAVVDRAGTIVKCNRKWDETARCGQLFRGQSRLNYIVECEAAVKRNCAEAAHILEGLLAVLRSDLPTFVSTYVCPFNEKYHWFQVQISAVDIAGERHAILMHIDVSALQRDALTGLPNRALFDGQLDLTLSLARASGRQAGVIIVDLNKLKSINDNYGHRVGDEALRTISLELKKLVGRDCVTARIGGDEFGVVVPTNLDVLSTRRMRARFGSGLTCSVGPARNPITISASVGFAVYPEDGKSATELLNWADKSMYDQKRALSVA